MVGCLHCPSQYATSQGEGAEELQCCAGPSSAARPSTAPADEDDDDDIVIMDGPSAADGVGTDDDVMIVDEVKPPTMLAAADIAPDANGSAGKRGADADLEGPRKRRKAS